MKKMILYFVLLFLSLFIVYGIDFFKRGFIKSDDCLSKNVVYEYDYQNLKREYEELQSQFGFLSTLEDFHLASKVIFKDPYEFYDVATILRGSEDGIEVGDVVVNDVGYVGIVSEVSPSSSFVELLLNSKTQMSVVVEGAYGILSCKNHSLIVDHITKKEPILEGSVVYTSKYSKIPLEIPIGKVREVKTNSKEQNLYIEPLVDFDTLSYVSIRKGVSLEP